LPDNNSLRKNINGVDPIDQSENILPTDEEVEEIVDVKDVQANIINILSLIGKMELKEYSKELGESYLIDVISPIIN